MTSYLNNKGVRIFDYKEVITLFDQLTPGYQRNWARYVFGVKNETTTEKRFAEMENALKQRFKSLDLFNR